MRADGELIGVLRFQSFGSLATAESADGRWTFERVGFWQNKTVVRSIGSKTNLGLFKENRWVDGGVLELPGGRRYTATTNSLGTNYEIRDEAGVPLMRLCRSGIVRPSVRVSIHSEAAKLQELPWLVMLGYYLMVMDGVDAANER